MRTSIYLIVFYFFSFATLGIIFPFAPLYLKKIGFTGTEIGIILAMIPLNKFLVTRVWTSLFEKTSNKSIFILIAILLSNLSLLLMYYYTTSFMMVTLSIFLYSFFRAGVLPILDTYTMEHSVHSKLSYGQIRLFGSIGFIISVTITGLMIDTIGLEYFVLMVVGMGMMVLLPFFFITFSTHNIQKKSNVSKSLGRDFYIVVFVVTLYFISFTFNNNFLNIKIEEYGMSQLTAGNMWAVGVLFEVVIMFFSGKFMHLYSSQFWLSIALLAGTLRVFIVGITGNIYLLYFANFLHGIAFGLFHLAMMYFINNSIEKDLRLKAQSIYAATTFGLGTILGSISSGITYDHFGVDITFLIASVISAISFIILVVSIKNKARIGNYV